jgi:hypothetical protein
MVSFKFLDSRVVPGKHELAIMGDMGVIVALSTEELRQLFAATYVRLKQTSGLPNSDS